MADKSITKEQKIEALEKSLAHWDKNIELCKRHELIWNKHCLGDTCALCDLYCPDNNYSSKTHIDCPLVDDKDRPGSCCKEWNHLYIESSIYNPYLPMPESNWPLVAAVRDRIKKELDNGRR